VNLLRAFVGPPELDRIYHCDLFTLCDAIPPQSVDMILCDLPYGTTACAWDEVIPFPPMWARFKRVIKPRGAIVLTASQPFTSALVMSNPKWFRYEWVWLKSNGGGFLNANRQPLKRHENVLVFYDGLGQYEPQMVKGEPYRCRSAAAGETTQDQTVAGWVTINDGKRYPTSVLDYDNDTGLHPTQKPVALFEYLIRTYTQPGDLVLDPTAGSGTTALAARNTQRRFICGDTSAEYVEVARNRLAAPYTVPMFAEEVA
jgi:site-specific DNA-methyltransferase (adenine-specific)